MKLICLDDSHKFNETKSYFQRVREEINKEQVKGHLEQLDTDSLPSPHKHDASIHLIRVPSVAVNEKETDLEPDEKKHKSRLNLESRLSSKENDKTVKKHVKKPKDIKKMNTKQKSKATAKKTTLLPGQKTLNHFFK